jgi:hypothetical protein
VYSDSKPITGTFYIQGLSVTSRDVGVQGGNLIFFFLPADETVLAVIERLVKADVAR